MILVDFAAIIHQGLYASDNATPSESELRHIILNTLREFNLKFRDEYKEMIICCESGSWRRDVFPAYKASRRAKPKDDRDWDAIWTSVNKVLEEIQESLPWHVIRVSRAEADDIIGTICINVREPIMIISRDKDFFQLHIFENVKQHDPVLNELITVENPIEYAFTHVFKGDASDGIPNIHSDDDHFTKEERTRQKAVSKKLIAVWMASIHNLQEVLSEDQYKHFKRNYELISLSATPAEVKKGIRDAYQASTEIEYTGGTLEYFMEHDLNFIDLIGDFK